jgi:hypothetical protein
MQRAYPDTGHAAISPVGGARSELFDAADVVEFGARWMERNLAPQTSSATTDSKPSERAPNTEK